MGKKQLKILLILLVVMGAAALALKTMQSGRVVKSKSITDRESLITDFPINDVAEVEIVDGEASVTLKKGEDATWSVLERDDYTANSESLVSFLRMIWALKITQIVQVGESQYGRLHLLPASEGQDKKEGEVEKTIYFKGKDGKVLKTVYLGKAYERMENSASPMGGGPRMSKVARYVKIAGEDGVFLVAETFDAADSNPAKWLDEKFFKIENIKSVEIKSGNKDEDWKLTRDKSDGEFVLADVNKDEEYDATRANAMKNAFSSPRFEDVVTGEAAKTKPSKTTFLIDTFAGFHYVVKVGEKSDLNEYFLTVDVSAKLDDKRKAVKDESEEDKKKNDEAFEEAVKVQKEKLAFEKSLSGKVFKVRSYVVDSINKKRVDLMKQAGPPAGAQAGGMPGGFPGGGAGGLPPGLQLPPGFKMPAGVQMPGGHPPVKKAAVPTPAPKAKKPEVKKDAAKKLEAKAAKPAAAASSEVKKEVKGKVKKPAEKAAPKKSGE